MTEQSGPREVRQDIFIEASAETVFSFLTDATAMKTWLAEIVEADPVRGGVFHLAEPGGLQIDGTYVEVVPRRKVVFTWGGILGLAPGQSTIEILLEPRGSGTLLKLRHYGLPPSAVDEHDRDWAQSGLPKLKAAAEGGYVGVLCLGSHG